MTHDPIAAFFADASRQWRGIFKQDGQELETLWLRYVRDSRVDRIETHSPLRDDN